MKNYIPTNSLKSSWAMVEARGLSKPERKTPWERSQTVPFSVRLEREKQAVKEEVTANRERLAAAHTTPKLGIHAQTVKRGCVRMGFKVLGHGVTVKKLTDVFALADSEGRAFVKVDGAEVVRPVK